MAWHFQIVVNNCAAAPLEAEHGLAVYCRHDDGRTFLFDTGAGNALLHNLQILQIPPEKIPAVILSHGHNDHTGGISDFLSRAAFYCTPEITSPHYSCHPGKAPRNLTIPEKAQCLLRTATICPVERVTEISAGVWLTGAIPRISGEDTGGPFFTAAEGGKKDNIIDEQALFFADGGTLLQGCCHAGIINTINYCRTSIPDCRIDRIIGGLHLLNASREHLTETAKAIMENGVKELYLLHCTGDRAVDFLRHNLSGTAVFTPSAGDFI